MAKPTTGAAPYAVLYPAVAEVAHRTGATAVGLIDVGSSSALKTGVGMGRSHADGVGVAPVGVARLAES